MEILRRDIKDNAKCLVHLILYISWRQSNIPSKDCLQEKNSKDERLWCGVDWCTNHVITEIDQPEWLDFFDNILKLHTSHKWMYTVCAQEKEENLCSHGGKTMFNHWPPTSLKLTAMMSCCLMPCPLLSCLVLYRLLGSGSKAQCPSQGHPNRPPPAASTSSSGGTMKYPQDSRET